jgi:hypothetical protein
MGTHVALLLHQPPHRRLVIVLVLLIKGQIHIIASAASRRSHALKLPSISATFNHPNRISFRSVSLQSGGAPWQ